MTDDKILEAERNKILLDIIKIWIHDDHFKFHKPYFNEPENTIDGYFSAKSFIENLLDLDYDSLLSIYHSMTKNNP